jgi:hypothetical protein
MSSALVTSTTGCRQMLSKHYTYDALFAAYFMYYTLLTQSLSFAVGIRSFLDPDLRGCQFTGNTCQEGHNPGQGYSIGPEESEETRNKCVQTLL